MPSDRIDFISAYCDRWCERCAFTDRCSSFACSLAIGMCGDVADGIELAVGVPEPVDGVRQETAGERMLRDFVEPSAEEMAEIERREAAHQARVKQSGLARMSNTYALNAAKWLTEHRDGFTASADPSVREALEIVSWDAFLIGAKVRRAVDGRDRHQQDEDGQDDDAVQNDWNGSAKVALISLARSEAAWTVIAKATDDRGASILTDAAAHLRRMMLQEFPDWKSFIRPGFDEPGR